jgi:serine/threonine protein kinase
MAISFPDFWKLIIESHLFTADQCQQLSAQYGHQAGAAGQGNAKSLAEWLVSQNVLSRYQASIILGGRSGPFFYGEYKIYDRIENGRLASAFRAAHSGSNHPVLLLFLTGQAAQDPQRWQQLQSTLPAIVHPNVVRCYAAVDLQAYKFLVLEDLHGMSVAEHISSQGPLPPSQACLVTRHAMAGLALLHQMGRPHGDVCPRNLWLDQSGMTKLLIDPDVVLQPLNVASSEDKERLLASADYMAPELARPDTVPSGVTDIYSMGCTLYEMLAGQVPFPGGSALEKLQRHATEAIKPLDATRVPAAIGQVVAYMMAKNPAVRFQQAAIVSEQVAPFLDPAGLDLQPPAPPATQAIFEDWLAQQSAAVPVATGAPSAAAALPAVQTSPQIEVPGAAVAAPGAATADGAVGTPISNVPASGPAVNLKAVPRGRGKAVAPTTAVGRAARERAKKKKQIFFAGSAVAAAVVVSIIGIVFLMNLGGPPEPAPASDNNRNVAKGGTTSTGGGTSPETTMVADDGDVLWASPTNGSPISFDMLPGGAQVFVVVRPRELLATDEGERLLRALGPSFSTARSGWEAASGFDLEEIDQIIIGMYGNGGQFPRVSMVVRPHTKEGSDGLLEKWGGPTLNENAGKPFYQAPNGWAYLVHAKGDGAFVMGHPTEIADLASTDAAAPLLRREIGQLLRVSDSDRHVNVLFAPYFLVDGDGRSIFTGEKEKALNPLSWFLGDGLKAAMMSVHLTDQLYFELRMESDVVVDRVVLATQFRDRMQEIPQAIETYMVNLNPGPYWRAVAFRYPGMISFLHEHTRIGVDGNHAVVNSVLPVIAAHNLVFGGEMMLASTPGMTVIEGPPKAAGPKTIEEVLKSKMSISFEQDSLEFSMQNVVNEVKSSFQLPFEFRIKIIGGDLELEGITRNRQIKDFAQKDQTVAEVLTAMVMKANPATTVKVPNEKDQTLLWVIAPDPDNPSNRIILITIRQIADQKYTVPEVFRLP